MRLVSVTLKNFRCYRQETTLVVGNLTTLIGRNDVGKSAVLEALEIFFNGDTVKIDVGDRNVRSADDTVAITCEFSSLPQELTLDAGAITSLADEYLLTSAGTLRICKTFDCSKAKPNEEIYIIANHPTHRDGADLLQLKEKDLQSRVKALGLDVSLKGNPGMRRAIWNKLPDLALNEVPIPIGKAREDGKRIWEQIKTHLPYFALFQSDRRSQDTDAEVQDPMRAAVTTALSEMHTEITAIQRKIEVRTREIAAETHAALQALDPLLGSELTPELTPPTPARWAGLFGVGMATELGIPLNKRGSGVRRLVLISFFKAAAERGLRASKRRAIIYAIEEPETAQHPRNQRVLLESFRQMTADEGCQILLSTHSPGLAADLPVDGLRFIERDGTESVIRGNVDVFGEIADSLGLVPDSRVRVLVCLEGPTDVLDLKALSHAIATAKVDLPDLSVDPRVAFVPLGGSTLKDWVTEKYLRGLGKPQVHIYDSDVAAYRTAAEEVNRRTDGSWAVITQKHEIESYLHPDAIRDAFGVDVEVLDQPDAQGEATPRSFAKAYSAKMNYESVMGDSKAKQKLAQAFRMMTYDRVLERDPSGEIEGWLTKLKATLDSCR